MESDTLILSALIPAVIVLVMMCLLSCFRCGRRSNTRGMSTISSTIYTVPTNYNAVNSNSVAVPVHDAPPASTTRNAGHHRIASMGDRFAVPLDLLPPHFDFNGAGVEHKGDHVLIKDLNLIHVPGKDEYQKQSPYNPNFQ